MEADWRSCRGKYLNMLPASEKVAFLDNAIIACANKKAMIKHNIDRAKASREPIAPIVAECNGAAATSESTDQAAGLSRKTTFSKYTILG